MYKDLQHWVPKPAGKKVFEMQFTQPHLRYERGHVPNISGNQGEK